MDRRHAAAIAVSLLTGLLVTVAFGASTPRESDRMSPSETRESSAGETTGSESESEEAVEDVVVSLQSEFIDIAGRTQGEPAGLTITANGTASTSRAGESLQLELSEQELDRLRRDLAADLAELDPSILVATDQGSTTVTVVDPAGGRTFETTVIGVGGPDEFRRAVDRLTTLIERIHAEGAPDEQ